MPAKQRYQGHCHHCKYLGRWGRYDMLWCKVDKRDNQNFLLMAPNDELYRVHWACYSVSLKIKEEQLTKLYLKFLSTCTKRGYIDFFKDLNK